MLWRRHVPKWNTNEDRFNVATSIKMVKWKFLVLVFDSIIVYSELSRKRNKLSCLTFFIGPTSALLSTFRFGLSHTSFVFYFMRELSNVQFAFRLGNFVSEARLIATNTRARFFFYFRLSIFSFLSFRLLSDSFGEKLYQFAVEK